MQNATLIRRTMIDLARRHVKPGSGSALRFLRERTCTMRYPDLRQVLGDVPWAVVGAVATRMYMPERLTQDLEVLVAEADATAASARLLDAGYRQVGTLSAGGATWERAGGSRVDVLYGKHPWTSRALGEAETNRDAHGAPVLPLPYLAIMKYEASRLQDVADLSRMLALASDELLDQVRTAFRQWLPAEMEDLESLISIGRLEIEPPTAE